MRSFDNAKECYLLSSRGARSLPLDLLSNFDNSAFHFFLAGIFSIEKSYQRVLEIVKRMDRISSTS